MTDVNPVSLERHGNRAWNKTSNFGWARQEQVVTVALQEATHLMMALPLAFLKHEGQYQFLALLGLQPGENLWVHADGRWIAPHVPGIMVHYPFRLLRDTEGRNVLGVDEEGLLPPGTTDGNPLFDEDGKPVAVLATVLEQLAQGELERQQARKIAGILAEHDLLEPWELQIQYESGMRKIEGLYRVNEKKFNELPAETLVTLRSTGALLMVYSQLLSMQHIQQLGRLAEAYAKVRQRNEQAQAAAQNPGGEHGIISFANL